MANNLLQLNYIFEILYLYNREIGCKTYRQQTLNLISNFHIQYLKINALYTKICRYQQIFLTNLNY